ncbi:hypothetical protein ACFL5G_03675 [Candidatus Margulisiibacteriota bacterium]
MSTSIEGKGLINTSELIQRMRNAHNIAQTPKLEPESPAFKQIYNDELESLAGITPSKDGYDPRVGGIDTVA